tara:strand:+ start:1363 stop:2160 length:798 start_codon:yes stop_codon:yes gene_type:complete
MNKQTINMVGGGFQHQNSSSFGHEAKNVKWFKDGSANISIHIDNGLRIPPNKTKLNYGWLSESKTIIGGIYGWCVNNIQYLEDNFELIFTHDTSLLPLSDKFKLVICSAKPWIKDVGIHTKSKLVSMISSNKVMCAEHKYRQDMVSKYRSQVDLFGRGFNPIKTKDEGLKDYYFSIAMENGTYPLMYSEKLTDCFATGTIPIYYGTPSIGEVFNTDGIITLDDNFNIGDLTSELYHSKLDAIKENLESVIEMPIAEDYIYEKYIK